MTLVLPSGIDMVCPINWSNPITETLTDCWMPLHGLMSGSRVTNLVHPGTTRRHGVFGPNARWATGGSGHAGAIAPISNAATTDMVTASNCTYPYHPVAYVVIGKSAGVPSGNMSILQHGSGAFDGYIFFRWPSGLGPIGWGQAGIGVEAYHGWPWVNNAWCMVAFSHRRHEGAGNLIIGGGALESQKHLTLEVFLAGVDVEPLGTPTITEIGQSKLVSNLPFNGPIAAVWRFQKYLGVQELQYMYRQAQLGYPELFNQIKRPWAFEHTAAPAGDGGSLIDAGLVLT